MRERPSPEWRLWAALGWHSDQLPDHRNIADARIVAGARAAALESVDLARVMYDTYGPQFGAHFSLVASYRGIKHGTPYAETPFGLYVGPVQDGNERPQRREVDWRRPIYGREGEHYPGSPRPELNPALWPDDVIPRHDVVERLIELSTPGANPDIGELEELKMHWQLHELQRANVLHYKWVLMVLYFMWRLELSASDVGGLIGRNVGTVQKMLNGESFGKPANRQDISRVLVRGLLERGFPVEWVAARVNQWGDWWPLDGIEPVFRLDGTVPRLQPPDGWEGRRGLLL